MAAIDTETTVVATDDCVATTIDGDVVVLNNETGMYQGFSGVGTDIWNLIQEPKQASQVVSELVAAYDVDRAQAAADVEQFLETLAAEHLIEVDANPAQ